MSEKFRINPDFSLHIFCYFLHFVRLQRESRSSVKFKFEAFNVGLKLNNSDRLT